MISASIAGPGIADRLDVPLPELAVAAGLRPVVAEHRPEQRQPHRLRPGLHAVLDVGADDARRRLGPERPALALVVAAAGRTRKSSFSTTSVTAPMPRSKTSACSNSGVSIGW